MTQSYIVQYIAQAEAGLTVPDNATGFDNNESYHAFTEGKLAQSQTLCQQKIAELDRQRALIEDQHQNELDQVTYLMRFRSHALRIATAIKKSVYYNEVINVKKTIIDSVNSIGTNCENDLDDDETYKMLFSQTFVQNDQINIQSKADYHALCKQLEANNTQIAANTVYAAARKRFKAIKDEPASDKYAQKIMAGFAEVEDILQQGSTSIGFDLKNAYGAALSGFDIYNEDSFNAKVQLALRKITAVNLLQDLERFTVNIGQSVTPALIKDLKAIDISAERFKHAKLPVQDADKLSALTSAFIDALQNGQRSGSIEKDIAYITQELKSPTYVVHGLI
jgi:hypothetical protein